MSRVRVFANCYRLKTYCTSALDHINEGSRIEDNLGILEKSRSVGFRQAHVSEISQHRCSLSTGIDARIVLQ